MDKLVTFLYVLMRDEVTLGTIERIMKEHVDLTGGNDVLYSNSHLEEYARLLADRLMKD